MYNSKTMIDSQAQAIILQLENDFPDDKEEQASHAKEYTIAYFDQDIDEKMRASFFNVNAPAILFPYVRAHITTLTSLSGIKPIILPTLNLSSRNEQ